MMGAVVGGTDCYILEYKHTMFLGHVVAEVSEVKMKYRMRVGGGGAIYFCQGQ